MPPTILPLTTEHLAQIDSSLSSLADAQRQIELAQAAGLDMGAQAATVADLQKRLKAIRQVYFPGA